MAAALDVKQHLNTEISSPDPWRLESNPFEQRRYQIMLDMIGPRSPFEHGLEIGCAAGAFTQMIAAHCKNLHVVDVLPAAIKRASERLAGRQNVTWEVAGVTDGFAAGQKFDLIVVAEVLCYLPSIDALRQAVAELAGRLKVGGLLVFGSAIDETCARWGLFGGGAETSMREWDRHLRELAYVACTGSYWGENCRIVAYTRDDEALVPWRTCVQEEALIPHKAVTAIPATSVVVLAPHADDEVLGCGGAIIRHVEQGVPVRVVIATSSARGGTLQRKEESRAAARVLGYGEPTFWDLPDHALAYGEPLIERVMQVIDGADLIYAPSVDEVHPDHRALGMAAIEAVRRKGGNIQLALYEVSAPLHPNLLLDIANIAARKQAAIACFKSQLQKRRYDGLISALNRYRTYTLSEAVTAAEAYQLVSAKELERDPLTLHRPEHERQLALAALTTVELRRSIAELEGSLHRMRASTSWKITGPLRSISRLIRHRAHPPSVGG
jgi:LmbE family N-acetylglucosaminyl deacetylase